MKKTIMMTCLLLLSTSAWGNSIWQMSSEEAQYKATMRVLLKIVKKQVTMNEQRSIKRLRKTKSAEQVEAFYESYRQDFLFPADKHWLKEEWDKADQVFHGFVAKSESFFSFDHPAEKEERCGVYGLNYLINICASPEIKQKNITLLQDNAKECKKEYNMRDLIVDPAEQEELDTNFCMLIHYYRVKMQLGIEEVATMSAKELTHRMWESHQRKTTAATTSDESGPTPSEAREPKPKQKLGDRLLKSIF